MTNTFWLDNFWENPEGVTAVGTAALAVITLLTLFSIVMLRRQMIGDHERSRREMAVTLMQCYCSTSDPTDHEYSFALGILHVLTQEQCHDLWNRQPFTIDIKHQHFLDAWRKCYNSKSGAGKRPSQSSGGTPLNIPFEEVVMLRSVATNMLNKLEMIASAWHNNIADREIIDAEFVRVFNPRPGVYILEKFREASGIYPSIGRFCDHFKSKSDSGYQPKPAIEA